jgi:esterase/lipase superfamily enzyme
LYKSCWKSIIFQAAFNKPAFYPIFNRVIMKLEKLKWNSPSLGKKIELHVYGTEGTPIIYFDGYPEYINSAVRTKILNGLRLQIDHGFNQIFCPRMMQESDIMNADRKPERRISLYYLFESFINDEVLPRVKSESGHDFVILVGVGMGAYNATNLAFKHPGKYNKLIAACGPVNLRPFFEDFFSDDFYYNNPAEFLPNLHDEHILSTIRNNDIRLISTVHDEYKDEIMLLSDELSMKSIDHVLDIWGEDKESKPEIWAEMLQKHVP